MKSKKNRKAVKRSGSGALFVGRKKSKPVAKTEAVTKTGGVSDEDARKARVAAMRHNQRPNVLADADELPPALAKLQPGTIIRLEAIIKERADLTLSTLAERYPSRPCANCKKKFSLLAYIARRGALAGRFPARCADCSKLAGQPWFRWNGTYQKVKAKRLAEERVSKARAAAR